MAAEKACRHDRNVEGLCLDCGMTYADQSKQRKCDSTHIDWEGGKPVKLHTCYLPYNHEGQHENHLGTRVW